MKKNHSLGFLALGTLLYAQQLSDMHEQFGKSDTVLKKYKPKPVKEHKNTPSGTKEFKYGNVIIYAINKKNADRKAKKLGILSNRSNG